MARRRRVDLSAIASLDDDIARARQRCEDQVQRAYETLQQAQHARGSAHDRYLECLRGSFQAADRVHAGMWPDTALQSFLGRFFAAYRDPEAFARLRGLVVVEGARVAELENGSTISIDAFDALRNALRTDTATRLCEHDPLALRESTHRWIQSQNRTAGSTEETELALPRLARHHGKRPRPGPPPSAAPSPPRVSPSARSHLSVSAVQVSERDASASLDDDNDGRNDDEYAVPTTSVLVSAEFSADVAKKSQNWFGRWRSRQLLLRWNELELRKSKSGATATAAHRHGVARAFPSQPALATTGSSVAAAAAAPRSVHSASTTSTKTTKRYALQNLISIQLVQLNESDPKHAIDVHFKQPAANGHGHTTKSLILGSDKGLEALKKIMALIATMALFRGLVAGEKAQQLKRFVQAGANVNAFCTVPSRRPVPMSPLQLVLAQCAARADTENELVTIQILLEAKADPRCLLHWHFARRTLLTNGSRVDPTAIGILLPTTATHSVQLPLTAFGSDEHGWSLLMYLSLAGDLERVRVLLARVRRSSDRDSMLRYVEHVNGNGDTALHVAIKATRNQRDDKETGESVALEIAKDCLAEPQQPPQAVSSLFYTSDAHGESVLHLALKARMWKLVDWLLEHKLVDASARDGHGGNALHVAIKIGAPGHVLTAMVRIFQQNGQLEARDRVANASPLLLAILHRREDAVRILLDGHAVTVGTNEPPGNRVLLSKDGEDDPASHLSLLHLAIRIGLPHAARQIWQATTTPIGPIRVGVESSLALAIRHGMYRLAYSIARDLSTCKSGSEYEGYWFDPESGDPVSVLAVVSNQLELAAVILDSAGPASGYLPNASSGETFLHAIAKFASGNRSVDAGRRSSESSLCGEKSWLKSKSDGDMYQPLWARNAELQVQESDDHELSAFNASVAQELFCMGILHAPSLDVLTAVARCSDKSLALWQSHDQVTGIENHEQEPRLRLTKEVGSTLLQSLASGASVLSYQLLALALAAVRIKCNVSNPASQAVEITKTCAGTNEETPIAAALARGRTDTALLLLHHLLPAELGQDDAHCAAGEEWMALGETAALHLACRNPTDQEAVMIVGMLLQADVYPGSWDEKGLCPLHVAIQHDCDERMIQVFKKYEQDLNVWSEPTSFVDFKGANVAVPIVPLMIAIECGNIRAFRELVRCGADMRVTTPQLRLGLLQFAVRVGATNPETIYELVQLKGVAISTVVDSDGMAALEAADILRCRLDLKRVESPIRKEKMEERATEQELKVQPCESTQAGETQNRLLSITLLGLQTPDLEPMAETHSLPPLSPSRDPLASFQLAPPRSSSRSPAPDDCSRGRRLRASPEHPLREPSGERSGTPLQSRNPHLEDASLAFLRGEEKATLMVIAHEARAEAHEWLKKRSGQKKLLSEARAQLQTTQSHRRTGSGTIVMIPESALLVGDEQLLETYKALAAKQFVDKHVADAVADARVVIEHEKRLIFKDTGVFPGDIPFLGKFKDSSIGSTSSKSGDRLSRPGSGSMLLLSSRTNDPDPGTDSDRGGTKWWSDRAGTSVGDDDSLTLVDTGTFLEEKEVSNGTWLTTTTSGHSDDADVGLNPLDRESFLHVIEKRKSLD